MNQKVPSYQKRIDKSYEWKYPTIVDRHPEMIELLNTNPLYVDALYLRKLLMKRMEREALSRIANEDKPARAKRKLFDDV